MTQDRELTPKEREAFDRMVKEFAEAIAEGRKEEFMRKHGITERKDH